MVRTSQHGTLDSPTKGLLNFGLFGTIFLILANAGPAWCGGLTLGDMCRIKGLETNQLQGLGLVVGLRGTGDADSIPKARALARMMQLWVSKSYGRAEAYQDRC